MKQYLLLTESHLKQIVKKVLEENFKQVSWEDIWFKLRRLSQSFYYPDTENGVYSFGGLDFIISKQGESLELLDLYKDPYNWRREYYKGVEVLEKYANKIERFVDEFNMTYDYPFELIFESNKNFDMKFYTKDKI